MDFRPRKKYIGSTDGFSIEMYPQEVDRKYKNKGLVVVYYWHVRLMNYGVPKKVRVSLGQKGVLELLEKYGYLPEDLQWVSEDCFPHENNPWMAKIENTLVRSDCVYFILAEGANRVKIGIATDLCNRFHHISTASPFPVTLLLSIRGSYKEERALHEKFAHLRVHCEWFLYTDELKAFIENLKRAPEEYRLTS